MQGPAIIAEKLGYFIQTGQATQLMQQAGFRIGNIELSSFLSLARRALTCPWSLESLACQVPRELQVFSQAPKQVSCPKFAHIHSLREVYSSQRPADAERQQLSVHVFASTHLTCKLCHAGCGSVASTVQGT